MGTRFPIDSYDRPSIRQDLRKMRALVNHRLDREHVASLNLWSQPGSTIIRNLRILVHLSADPMPNVIAHNRIPIRFGVLLHCPAYITEMVSRTALLDRTVQTLFSHANQL